MSEQAQSRLTPYDVLILGEMVDTHLKETTSPVAIQNLTALRRRLSWEYGLAEEREQVILNAAIAAYKKRQST